MKRDLYAELLKWKNSENRKPLIIRGVRQCGKTYLMKQFGDEQYGSVAYLNFEDKNLCKFFDSDLEPKRIISVLSIYLNKDITPDTLIIFDEIHECGRAVTSLKSFRESAPEYSIICASSHLNQCRCSFPVGNVSFLDLYPMSFREFVRASNERLYNHIIEINEPDEITKEKLKPLNT